LGLSVRRPGQPREDGPLAHTDPQRVHAAPTVSHFRCTNGPLQTSRESPAAAGPDQVRSAGVRTTQSE